MFEKRPSSHHIGLTLVGNYHVWVTTKEAEEWHEFISSRPEWKDLQDTASNQQVLALRQVGNSTDLSSDIRRTEQAYQTAKDRIWELARDWYTSLLERTEAEEQEREREQEAKWKLREEKLTKRRAELRAAAEEEND